MSDKKILARLKDWNCEWLLRPNIVISEMAQTIKENWELIERYKGTIFTVKFVNKMGDIILPLMEQYRRLDKDNSINETATHGHVLDVLEVININPDVEQLMVDTFNVAGPVLMTSI